MKVIDIKSFSAFVTDDESHILFEMSNLTSKDTGLDYIIWLIPKNNSEKHGPRLKVRVNNVLIPVSICDEPRVCVNTNLRIPEFRNLQEWIITNKDLLLEYWDSDGSMNMRDLLDRIIKVGEIGEHG